MQNDLMSSSVLLVIDAQHDFLSSEAPYACANSPEIIQKIAEALAFARKIKMPVIFTREVHSPTGRDYGLELTAGAPPHCIEGTPGVEIVTGLIPQDDEIILDKRRYSAFLGTHLDLLLRAYGSPTLFLTGFTTNVCVHYTAVEAFQRDFPVHVIRECVSATTEEKHHMGLRMLEFVSEQIPISLQQFYATNHKVIQSKITEE